MSINWTELLRRYRVPWVEEGPNVSKGHINIQCPFCGDDDPSEHMGLNLSSGRWGCWRDDRHRGNSPERLIMQLLKMGKSEAIATIAEESSTTADLGAMRKSLLDLIDADEDAEFVQPLNWDVGICPMDDRVPCGRFWRYLANRFSITDAKRVAERYRLRYSVAGKWNGRLIVPVHNANGELVAWTGRSIGASGLKYLTYPPGNAVKLHLYDENQLVAGGAALVICEGPFDAMKIDYYGLQHGIRATCVFGKTLTSVQRNLILDISGKFEHVVIMLDVDAWGTALRMQEVLWMCEPRVIRADWVQEDASDPADLKSSSIPKILGHFSSRKNHVSTS